MITKQNATKLISSQSFWEQHPNLEMIENCINAGADLSELVIDPEYPQYQYPIITRAAEYCPEVIPTLVKAGADVNQPAYNGELPVESASYWAAIKPIGLQYILAAGGNAHVVAKNVTLGCTNPEGQKILQDIQEKVGFFLPNPGNLSCIGWLLEEGAEMYDDYRNPNNPEVEKRINQIAEETRQKMKMLFQAGIDPDAPARYNEPAIFSTIINGYLKASQIILDCGGHIDVKNPEGNSVLNVMGDLINRDKSYERDHPSYLLKHYGPKIKFLLQHGANPYLKNNQGVTFMDKVGSISFVKDMVRQYAQKDNNIKIPQHCPEV